MRTPVGKPGRVGDRDLTARHVYGATGIDQHHVQPVVVQAVAEGRQ
ncbi:hypothetical protein [Arthrobacter globiformis]|nr:hypothetical protein [Arthrobacter globiformis]MDQ0867311.1 hypothetical protein [Arthrobacter globiformis]